MATLTNKQVDSGADLVVWLVRRSITQQNPRERDTVWHEISGQ